MRKLFRNMALVMVTCLLCLTFLNWIYVHKIEDPMQEVNVFVDVVPNLNIANLGSSHGSCDLDWKYAEYHGYPEIESCNMAMSSQSLSWDLAILNQYRKHFRPGESVLVIPLSYFSFHTESPIEEDAEALSIRYMRVLSPRNNPGYDFYKDLVGVRLPILSAEEELMRLAKPPYSLAPLLEKRNATINPLTFADVTAVLTGRNKKSPVDRTKYQTNAGAPNFVIHTCDPNELPDDDLMQKEYGQDMINRYEELGKARYERHFQNRETYFREDQLQALEDILAICREENITPVLLTVPYCYTYNQHVSQEFMDDFHAHIKTICDTYGVSYYDYSHVKDFQKQLYWFADGDHLNEQGRQEFTMRLIHEVPEIHDLIEWRDK